MATLKLILVVLLCAAGAHQACAGWKVLPDQPTLYLSEKEGDGHATFEEALKDLVDAGEVQKLRGIVAHYLMRDATFQKELFAALEKDAPVALKEALHSAGNIHNPKMYALDAPFKKAVLATPTVTAMNAALAPHGFKVTHASTEKLMIRKSDEGPRLNAMLWLGITKAP